jgi:hypothetical protein
VYTERMIKESTEYLNLLAARIELQKSSAKFDGNSYVDYESSMQVNVM